MLITSIQYVWYRYVYSEVTLKWVFIFPYFYTIGFYCTALTVSETDVGSSMSICTKYGFQSLAVTQAHTWYI